jgi:hypothetical protein
VPFHGRDLDRLMFERIEPVQVAEHELQRRGEGDHPRAHAHHGPCLFLEHAGEQITGADGEHHDRRREVRGVHGVREAVRETRVEDDGEPVDRIGDAAAHLVAHGRVHPTVGGEDPEPRQRRTDRDQHGRGHVQPRRHPLPAEQHHAEERRFEEEGGDDLVADEGPDDVADDLREAAPVRAALVGHRNPRHDPHREGDGEDLRPEAREPMEVLLPGEPPAHEKRSDEGRQSDGEGREDDVETDGEGELDPCQQFRIDFHGMPPRRPPDGSTLRTRARHRRSADRPHADFRTL